MHSFTKSLTFTPLSRGRYRCNQTGQILTQRQILSFVYTTFRGGQAPVMKVSAGGKPPKKAAKRHASKYRSKKR